MGSSEVPGSHKIIVKEARSPKIHLVSSIAISISPQMSYISNFMTQFNNHRNKPPVGLKQSDGLGPPRLSNLGGGVGQMPITIFIGQKRKNRQEGLSQTTSNSIPGM